MFEYLLDLWDQLMISYQLRLSFLASLLLRKEPPKQLYQVLEAETALLADFKNETAEVFALMRQKESQFGNIFTARYH